jgi:hypothetical protein
VRHGRKVWGDKFALYVYAQSMWRFPWQRPRGGWRIGRLGFWWSR